MQNASTPATFLEPTVLPYSQVATPDLLEGRIDHYHPDFVRDYRLLHCLVKKHITNDLPKSDEFPVFSFLEIGTHIGTGTTIICNAIPESVKCNVYSLDLPLELSRQSSMHPMTEGRRQEVGSACNLPYTQLYGDSLQFDYASNLPARIDGFFIDGAHDYEHVYHESSMAMQKDPALVVWHDADDPEVLRGIKAAVNERYQLFLVDGTRIAFAVKKQAE
jgi:hypothetical protein